MLKTKLWTLLSLSLIAAWLLTPRLFSSAFASAPEADSPPAERIENGLRESVQAQGQGTYWVRMAEQADLSAAYGIQDWNARGEYVYNTLLATARESQAGLIRFLEAEMRNGNVVSYRSFFINNSVLVTSNLAVLDSIAARGDVSLLRATRAYPVPELTPVDELEQIQAIEWGVSRIRSPEIWTTFGTTGQGIVVANIDTGVAYTHAALVNQYRGNLGGSFDHNFNWYDPTGLCSGSAPCDQNDHGTHTMGTIVGDDGGSNQIGNAPGAKWIAARGCEANTCSDAALTASWEWMIAPCALGDDPGDPSCDPSKRPHILNYSIGGPGGDPSTQDEVNAARAAGIVLSISAGNSGPGSNTVGSPGDYCNVIGVGATDINDVIASFSSRGPGNFDCGDPEMRKPDVSAPGVNVRSSVANGSYASFNGTSMAAPHVTGCAALLRSIDPNITHDEIFNALINTAVDLGSAGFDFSYGYGRIDCYEAALFLFPPGTPVPTPTPTSLPPGTVFFDDFETNQGWVTNPFGSDTATTGQWERGDPEGTDSSGPKQLGNTVSGVNDLVTGRLAGSSVGANDIDNGVTSIRSPNISLPSSGNLTLSFWYYLAHLNNATSADFLRVTVVGTTSQVVFEELGAGDDDDAVWEQFSVSLNAFAGQTVYLLIEAADAGAGSLVEAAIDDVLITADDTAPTPTNTPLPPTNTPTTLPTNTPTPLPTNTPTPLPTNTPTPIPTNTPLPTATPTSPPPGTVFFDDFETNQGWVTNPFGSDTATTGQWERGDPEGTDSSGPKQLGNTVSGVNDLVTGRLAGSSVGANDIDNGVTSIRSPNIALPAGQSLTLSFSYYLAHLNNATSADFLRVTVVGTTSQVVFEELGAGDDDDAVWEQFSVSLNAFAGQTVYLLIEAADAGAGSLVEAAIDDVLITSNGPLPTPTPGPSTVFFDDFETNQGWVTNPFGSDTATTGQWERGDPQDTNSSGPKQLGTTVSGSFDLVTGATAGSGVGSFDIDNGVTSIRSPNISLPSSGNLTLSFWYYLAHLNNATSADFLRVTVVGTTSQVVFEELGAGNDDDAVWEQFSVSLNAFAGQTVYLLIEAADAGSASLVEAAIDDLLIVVQ